MPEKPVSSSFQIYDHRGGGEMTACNSYEQKYEQKTAKMAQNPGFALRWHVTNGAERYGFVPEHTLNLGHPTVK